VHKNYALEIRDRPIRDKEFILVRNYLKTVGEIQGIGFLRMTTMVMALEQLRNSTTGWIANRGGGDFFCWPNWDEETYPEIQDLVLIPLFAILFPTLRFFLDKFVFEVRYVFSQAQQQLLLHVFLFFFKFVLAPNRPKMLRDWEPQLQTKKSPLLLLHLSSDDTPGLESFDFSQQRIREIHSQIHRSNSGVGWLSCNNPIC
jgi:hypothetical protein